MIRKVLIRRLDQISTTWDDYVQIELADDELLASLELTGDSEEGVVYITDNRPAPRSAVEAPSIKAFVPQAFNCHVFGI